jgi:hypothetical protein
MFVMPEIVVRHVIEYGISQLRKDKLEFIRLFAQYAEDELTSDYGPKYIEELWDWFSTTKLPVIQAWQLNTQRIPCVSIHLANETEDESKAAMGDIFGDGEGMHEINTGVMTVMIDIGIHANRAGDHVLWMYYIVSHILFRQKLLAERLGLKLHTFSASDYNKDAQKMGNNIWTRWVRFRCTTENFVPGQRYSIPEEVNLDATIQNYPPARDFHATSDLDPHDIDPTANKGLVASRVGYDDEDDENII